MARIEHFFFNLLRKTNVSVMDIFSGLKIAKYNKDGTINKMVDVPVKFGTKEKFYYWVNDRSNVTRLPMSAITLNGLHFDKERMGNKNSKFSFLTTPTTAADAFISHNNLYPWNVDYTLHIATQFIVEMDQILEQVLPFFDPCIFLTIDIPEISNSFNIKLCLNNVTPKYDNTMQENDYRTISYELGLTAKTYLLRPVGNIGLIKDIFLDFYSGMSESTDKETIHIDENWG